jgi:hypothetical protein
MKLQKTALIAILVAWAVSDAAAQTAPVTLKNFARAESDSYFAKSGKMGAFGKFMHIREPTPIDKQDVVRMNRDTLYSAAVFDLDASAVTISLPKTGNRFLSLLTSAPE